MGTGGPGEGYPVADLHCGGVNTPLIGYGECSKYCDWHTHHDSCRWTNCKG